MSELQPPDLPTNGETPTPATAPADPPTHLGLTSKRQRRPSVRLGDIGDQPATLSYESYRRNKLWRDSRYQFYHQKDSKPSSRTRPLTNLGNGHQTLDPPETLDGPPKKSASRGARDLKGKRAAAKRARSTWVSSGYGEDELYGGGFDGDRSESPLRQSPVQSMEDAEAEAGANLVERGVREELDGRSENDAREWKYGDGDRDSSRGLEEGVRMWLNGLGLGRYEPVFEINEVDEEVLPLLTLEDLKDMGINAVGSRRKLYSAIQKLGRGFS